MVDPATKKILWSDYHRHHTKQPEKMLAIVGSRSGNAPKISSSSFRMFTTGSGASPLCAPGGGKFLQEVNAVPLALEHLHPDVLSVIERSGGDVPPRSAPSALPARALRALPPIELTRHPLPPPPRNHAGNPRDFLFPAAREPRYS